MGFSRGFVRFSSRFSKIFYGTFLRFSRVSTFFGGGLSIRFPCSRLSMIGLGPHVPLPRPISFCRLPMLPRTGKHRKLNKTQEKKPHLTLRRPSSNLFRFFP